MEVLLKYSCAICVLGRHRAAFYCTVLHAWHQRRVVARVGAFRVLAPSYVIVLMCLGYCVHCTNEYNKHVTLLYRALFVTQTLRSGSFCAPLFISVKTFNFVGKCNCAARSPYPCIQS